MENNHNEKLAKPNTNTNTNANANNGDQVENPNSDRPDEQQQDLVAGSLEMAQSSPPAASARSSSRTPFTNLSQEDADLALARRLQEQERAFMMLRMNNEGSDYGSWEAGSYLHDDEDDFNDFHDETDADNDGNEEEEYEGTNAENDEDAFDVHAHHDDANDDDDDDDDGEDNNLSIEFDLAVFRSDEAYARALQDAEERTMARFFALAGINDHDAEDSEPEENGDNSQDAWEEVDSDDELSYEELLALGEVVGTESRGLSATGIASLPSINYKTGSSQNGSNDSCVICRLDYEDGETLTLLSCKHSYHPECINNWLKINKVCPVCNAEVSTSGNSL